jgi:hypothetical protein
MQLNARLEDFKGNGTQIYSVIFTNPYEDTPPDEIGVETWLANSEEHLKEELFEEFVIEGTYEEETFFEVILESIAIKQIGTVINITND